VDVSDTHFGLPLDFQPTWKMPEYESALQHHTFLARAPPPAPVHTRDKSITVIAMMGDDAKTKAYVEDLVNVCTWFDPGQCHLILSYPASIESVVIQHLMQKHPELQFVQDPANLPTVRTHKYGIIRNALLEKGLEQKTTYLMVADLDGVIAWNAQTLGAITNAMANDDKWDAVSFSSPTYYDWWAVRCNLDSPNCMATRPQVCYDFNYFDCVKGAKMASPETFTKVASAFNGLALYKSSAVGKCRYDGHQVLGRPNEVEVLDRQDCEHVALNTCMTASGKRFMLSSMETIGTGN